MTIKTGDKVKILAGKDKGKTGKVIQVFVEHEKVVVEGLNTGVKHMRSQNTGENGQKIEYPVPVHVSNTMIVCPKCDKTTRPRMEVAESEGGKKVKVHKCRKCKEVL